MNYLSSEVQVSVYQARNNFLYETIPGYAFVRAIGMEFFGNPKRYFNTVELSGHILAVWPAEIGTSNIKVLFQEVKWWLAFLCNISLVIPLLFGVYYFRNDSVLMTKALSETMVVIEYTFNLIQCRIQNLNFQVILKEMRDLLEHANAHEELLLKKYFNRYKSFQKFVALSFIACAFLFISLPIVTSQPLPADGWYPFSTEPYQIRIVLYISQVLAICQVGSGFIVDFIIAITLWFCVVKTELLKRRISEAQNRMDIKQCAYQHQQLILYTKRAREGIRYIILKTNLTMSMTIICGAFQLINHVPFEVVIRFVLLIVGGALRLYVSAKPADDLKENSENLAAIAFITALKQQSPSDARLALMLAHRCQKPIIISVTPIIKAWCLESYGSFLATSVKYFVNLRAVLGT